MAALILTAALAIPVAAQKQVPFKGTMQGNDTDIGGPRTAFVVDTSGTGIATHLGQFLIQPGKHGKPRCEHCNGVWSLDRGQWRQHLYDNCRIG